MLFYRPKVVYKNGTGFSHDQRKHGIQEYVSDAWTGVYTKAGHVAGMWPAPFKKFELRD